MSRVAFPSPFAPITSVSPGVMKVTVFGMDPSLDEAAVCVAKNTATVFIVISSNWLMDEMSSLVCCGDRLPGDVVCATEVGSPVPVPYCILASHRWIHGSFGGALDECMTLMFMF